MKKIKRLGTLVLSLVAVYLLSACSDNSDSTNTAPPATGAMEAIHGPASQALVEGHDIFEIDIILDSGAQIDYAKTVTNGDLEDFSSLIFILNNSGGTIFKVTDSNLEVVDGNTVSKHWPVHEPFSIDAIPNLDLMKGFHAVMNLFNQVAELASIEIYKANSGDFLLDYVLKNNQNLCERVTYIPVTDTIRYSDYNVPCTKNIHAYTEDTFDNFFDKDIFANSNTDGASDLIFDFLGDTFKDWAGSQVLSVIGLGDSTNKNLNEVLSELNTMETQLQSIAKDMQDVIAGMDQLINLETEDFTKEEIQALESYETNLGGGWNQYYSNGNGKTLDEIIADSGLSGAIAEILTNEFLQSVYDASEMISGNLDGTGTQYPTLLRDFLKSTVSLLTLTVPTQGTASGTSDFVKTIDQHNEGLMYQFAQIAKVLQQAFVMETTSLFFRYNLDGYDASLAEQGISYSDSYDTNYAQLQKVFQARFNQLYDLVEGAIITDGFKKGLDYLHANQLKNTDATKGGLGLPGGSWTDLCSLYVWSGLGYVAKYNGSWDGATLTAQCSLSDSDSVAEMSNTLTTECSDAGTTNIDYYYDNNISQGNLWCDSYNVDFIKAIVGIPGSNSSWNKWETSGSEIISLKLDDDRFTYLWDRDCRFIQEDTDTEIWSIDNWNDSGTPAVIFQYKARSGALGTFVVLVGDGDYSQIQCMNNDPWCSNEPSQLGLEIHVGGDHIRYIEVQKLWVEGFQLLN